MSKFKLFCLSTVLSFTNPYEVSASQEVSTRTEPNFHSSKVIVYNVVGHWLGKMRSSKHINTDFLLLIKQYTANYPYFKLWKTLNTNYLLGVNNIAKQGGYYYTVSGHVISRIDINNHEEPIKHYLFEKNDDHIMCLLPYQDNHIFCGREVTGNLMLLDTTDKTKRPQSKIIKKCKEGIDKMVIHQEKTLFIAASNHRIYAFDISDIGKLKRVASLHLPHTISDFASYNHLLFASTLYNVAVWHIAYNKEELVSSFIGLMTMKSDYGHYFVPQLGLYEKGHKTFLITGDFYNTICAYDISKLVNCTCDIKQLTEELKNCTCIRSFPDRVNFSLSCLKGGRHCVSQLTVQGDFLFTANGGRKIRVRKLIDIESKEPELINTIEIKDVYDESIIDQLLVDTDSDGEKVMFTSTHNELQVWKLE
ncbi:MAG: hypothetical protein AAF335_02165 [Bacteroidota bacterium]